MPLRKLLGIALFGLGLTTFSPAWAQQCAVPPVGDVDGAITAFDALRVQACLGGERCDSEVCGQVAAWEALPPSPDKTAAAGPVLAALRAQAEQLPADVPDAARLRARLAEWELLLTQAEVTALPTAVWQPAGFKLFTGHADEIDLERTFSEECAGGAARCAAVFAAGTQIYTYAVLQRRVLVTLLEKNRQETVAYLRRLDLRWQAYFTAARSQYPWEVWLNSALYERRAPRRGFVDAPHWQLIALHPSPAFQYTDRYTDRLDEAVVLEVLGWYQWRWGGADGARVKRPLGGALVVSWDGHRDADPGYGFVIHLPRNWSIGAVSQRIAGEDEVSALLSVDLAKFALRADGLRQRLTDQSAGE